MKSSSPGNVLITSVSKKVSLIREVRRAVQKINPEMKVFGGDSDKNCIGRYFVDTFWHMNDMAKLTLGEFISYCQDNHIAFIVPSRDGELTSLARWLPTLQSHQIQVMVSAESTVKVCLDKLLFYDHLKKYGFNGIPTVEDIDQLQTARYVVKERTGAGSRQIGLNLTKSQVLEQSQRLSQPVFQPYISGDEISVDLYVDKQRCVKGVVARTRDVIVNGESQVTTTFRDPLVEKLCSSFAEKLPFYGHVMVQFLRTPNNLFFLEVNARFGGASSASVAAGLDSLFWFLSESVGRNADEYPFIRNKKEITQVRYPENLIIYDRSF